VKVSLRWLSEFIDLPTNDPIEIRDALVSLGHEVEAIEHHRADWTSVVIASVLTVDPHPDADKVRVCTVDTGADPIRVVCGAWNFEAGAKVAFAMPGAMLAGGFAIGVRTIRGVESHGMICSERELGLGDEHAGILVLEPSAPVGVDFAEFVELPDVVFDLTITPNRPDMMSMVGVARELGAFYSVPHRRPDTGQATVPGMPSLSVTIAANDGCNRFTVREIGGVHQGDSPYWLRRRLRVSGVRPISNMVDVTNYVMLELGHPLHAFDADRVRGDHLEIRWAEEGERLITLDGVERVLTGSDLVICDREGPTSLAGTMGGQDSEVVETTTRVYMEAAGWDPPTILHMSRRHGLRSEASARFERGVDPNLPLEASARAVALLAEIGGGTILEGTIDVIANPIEPWTLRLTAAEVARTLGPGFEPDAVAGMLSSIGLGVSGSDPLEVVVPTFRPDLLRPIDLVEEIARLHGYDRFPDTVPTGRGHGWTPQQRIAAKARQTLVGVGLRQALSLTFINPSDLDAFAYPTDHEARTVVRVKNPLREEESILRSGLLPGLVRALRYNLSHGAGRGALFEVGKVFFHRPDAGDPRIPHQPDRLGFALVGHFGVEELGSPARPVDYHTALAIWDVLARRLGITAAVEPTSEYGFHPARVARVVSGGRELGVIGELHPSIALRFDLPGRVAVGEFDLAGLIEAVGAPRFSGPSVYPPVEFDLAFIFPTGVPAAAVIEATTLVGDGLVESCRVFDEYVGDQVGEGRRSLALRYVLRAPDRTLSNDDVAPIRRAMAAAAETLGGELRGRL
jgi:phenylalanyl-tRNA synthetase beta chain